MAAGLASSGDSRGECVPCLFQLLEVPAFPGRGACRGEGVLGSSSCRCKGPVCRVRGEWEGGDVRPSRKAQVSILESLDFSPRAVAGNWGCQQKSTVRLLWLERAREWSEEGPGSTGPGWLWRHLQCLSVKYHWNTATVS